MKGKLDLKIRAIELRKKGLSVKDIKKKLGVSLSSVSIWVRDVRLTNEQLKKLYKSKKIGSLKGSIIAAQNKKKQREAITERLKNEGKKEIGTLSKRDRFIIGVAIYIGEGGKTDRDISVVNSDFRLIKFMMNWFKDFCLVPINKFRGSIYIHDNLDENKAKIFWSKKTGIPLSQFTKSYIVKNKERKLKKTKHLNGIFRIKITDANLHRKIMGWVDGILN